MGHSRWAAPKAHGEHTAYGKTKRRDMPNLLRDCKPFEGHSMRAEWETHCHATIENEGTCNLHYPDTVTDHGVYVVFSYDQRIAAYDPVDGTLYLNERRYSPKTSEHQGNAAAWTGRDFANRDGTFGVQFEVVTDGQP